MIRQGRKNPHTLYSIVNDEPSDEDTFLGSVVEAEIAELLVEHFNGYYEAWQRIHKLDAEVRELRGLSEQRRQEIQRLQAAAGPLMTPEQKADTEAAFQRGVAHALNNMGQNKYLLNRDGIMTVGRASMLLGQAGDLLTEAVKALSEDVPAFQGEPKADEKRLYNAVVTPEEVAAQASDEADDWDGTFTPAQQKLHDEVEANTERLLKAVENTDCRCDEPTGVCRTHDVGR